MTVNGVQTYRDRNILYVNVLPVKCVSNSQTMACENLSYRVSYKSVLNGKVKMSDKMRHDVDEEFMSSLFTSTLDTYDVDDDMLKAATAGRWIDAPYYLILSIPEYESAISEFIEWKKCMGFNVAVRYSDSWTPESIKSEIQDFYDGNSNLQYVLLVGDAVSLPPVRHEENLNMAYEHSSDFSYGCMDGDDDMEQDIIVGRLSVANLSQAYTVINKIIEYERKPSLNRAFYSTALHASEFVDDDKDGYEDRRFVRTCEDIINGLSNQSFNIERIYFAYNFINPTNWNNDKYCYGEALPDELLKPMFQWNGSTSRVVDAINSGQFYVLHRGHGAYNCWDTPYLSINSLSNLQNGKLLPVFFNIHCQSGAFGHTEVLKSVSPEKYVTIEQSFSEVLLRMEGGGAVGIIAASELSLSGYNDVLAMELFQSMWPDSSVITDFPRYNTTVYNYNGAPVYVLGKILKKGLAGLSSRYSGFYIPYTKSIFHCFGDPSMRFYTQPPANVSLSQVSGNVNAIKSDDLVEMSLVLMDGSVKISRGFVFDATPYKDLVEKVSIYGRNLIPKILKGNYMLQKNINESGITDIKISNDDLDIKYAVADEKNARIIVKSINNSFGITRECEGGGVHCNVNISGFLKGVYVVELFVDGVLIDYKKVLI